MHTFIPTVVFRLLAVVCTMSICLLFGCERTATGETGSVIHLNVGGLHCDGCAATVRNEVAKMSGVRSCRVSFQDGKAVIEVDDPALVSAIIEKIESLEFTATVDDGETQTTQEDEASVTEDKPAAPRE